jgi:adenylate cyclase
MSQVTFQGDGTVVETVDETVLAAALRANVPLLHACGGLARCTTCRILVVDGAERCAPPTDAERALAAQRHLPPGVRLACQTRVRGDVTVRRLVTDDEDHALVREEAEGAGAASLGEERHLAMLFCDVRDFTPFAEAHPPYDVVHVLNRHFRRAVQVVERHGGRVDVFLGDGLMALFGLDGRPDAAERAVRAGLDLVAGAAQFSSWFAAHFGRPFRIGVGVHVGDVVLGTVGAGERRRLTAIGDAVNTASRVEAATKEAGVAILATEAVRAAIAPRLRSRRQVTVPIRGKAGTHVLYEVVGVDPAASPCPPPSGSAALDAPPPA